MYLINKERGKGKSYELIRDSYKTGVPIITATANSANYIYRQAKEMGLDIPIPMWVNQLVALRGSTEKPTVVLVDELTACLQASLGVQVLGATDTLGQIL